MINQQKIKKELYDFLKAQSKKVQDDPDKAANEFADKIASVIVEAVLSADIVIPIGVVSVVGATGPSSNIVPIVIKKSLK